MDVDVVVTMFKVALSLLPLVLFAALGETVAEKSGVVNLGIEGMMMMSAFTAFIVDLFTGSALLGIFAALGVVTVVGIVFSFFSISLRVDQIVAGLAVYVFGWGFSYVLYSILTGGVGSSIHTIPYFSRIPYLSSIPIVGPILFSQNALVYLSLILVPLVSIFLGKTTIGLRIRAVGENPKAADTMGVSVARTRYLAVIIGSLMAGLSGSYFTTVTLGYFTSNITQGRGFIALAMVYFANWNPYKILLAAFLYEFVDAAQSQILVLSGNALQLYSQLFNMLPYVFLLILIPILGRKARAPKYLTIPYKKS